MALRAMSPRRSFYFLQGNASWFYRRLGEALAGRGHAVQRLNFCGGDRHFWGDWQAADWRGETHALPAFLDEDYRRHHVDTIVMFGDCRPVHRAAIEIARRQGLEIIVFEEGYLRPNWLTLERQGVNGYSRLPDDPSWYRDKGRRLPAAAPAVLVGSGLARRIYYDFQWQIWNYLTPGRYPHYRTHRPYPIAAEYAMWSTRLAKLTWRRRQARDVAAALVRDTRRFFLFPLQLDTDSQIRVHAGFGRMAKAISTVIDEFAVAAPSDTHLVLKNHPLDNGWIDYSRLIRRHAGSRGIADRICFIDGGPLDSLLDHAAGVVTVNSTVGMTALERHRPVICLGKSVFDMPGLTFQGPLADFWHAPEAPDAGLLQAFRTVLQRACLVGGNFYTDEGVELAVANSMLRLEDPTDLLADAPPRHIDPDQRWRAAA
jgi:capsular polysaccharide export protein